MARGLRTTRLYPIYMGYETLLRGYTKFDALEGSTPGSVYHQLFGSKMLMANFELRFPLFQLLGLGGGWYGILPLDIYTYFDTGIAWYDSSLASEKPWFVGGDRRPLSSAGVGLRMNLFGYFVMGVSYSYPFDRPLNNGYFQITLVAGILVYADAEVLRTGFLNILFLLGFLLLMYVVGSHVLIGGKAAIRFFFWR